MGIYGLDSSSSGRVASYCEYGNARLVP